MRKRDTTQHKIAEAIALFDSIENDIKYYQHVVLIDVYDMHFCNLADAYCPFADAKLYYYDFLSKQTFLPNTNFLYTTSLEVLRTWCRTQTLFIINDEIFKSWDVRVQEQVLELCNKPFTTIVRYSNASKKYLAEPKITKNQ